MSLAENIAVSEQEYLQGEQQAEFKHEFLNGEVWGMVGASDRHVSLSLNLALLIKQKLKGTPCKTFISDMKVRVQQANAYFYPDVLVSCNPLDRENIYYKEHPVLIAEVLSPSTEAYDRGDKFRIYRQTPTLKEYLLIDQTKMAVDVFIRATDEDAWVLKSYSDDTPKIHLPALDIELDMQEIYEDIFTDEA